MAEAGGKAVRRRNFQEALSLGPGTRKGLLAGVVAVAIPPPAPRVPHALDVAENPGGPEGDERLCKERGRRQPCRLGGVSCNLRQLTGPICARRPVQPAFSFTHLTRTAALAKAYSRLQGSEEWQAAPHPGLLAGGCEPCGCGLHCPMG